MTTLAILLSGLLVLATVVSAALACHAMLQLAQVWQLNGQTTPSAQREPVRAVPVGTRKRKISSTSQFKRPADNFAPRASMR